MGWEGKDGSSLQISLQIHGNYIKTIGFPPVAFDKLIYKLVSEQRTKNAQDNLEVQRKAAHHTS